MTTPRFFEYYDEIAEVLHNKTLIGVTGYKRSGKDTVARELCVNLDLVSDWFAGPVKAVSSLITGIPEVLFSDDDYKEQPYDVDAHQMLTNCELGEKPLHDALSMVYCGLLPSAVVQLELSRAMKLTVQTFLDGPTTPRKAAQLIGTEWAREHVHPQIWVKHLFFNLAMDCVRYPDIQGCIIPDVRFLNEADELLRLGGKILRVERPGVGLTDSHASEREVALIPISFLVSNSGSKEQLFDRVRSWAASDFASTVE
jgi:hypothetical protein